jgi:hypothetical protein
MSISKYAPIRNWLMKSPRPSVVRLDVNGQEEPLELEVGTPANWKQIAETIINQGAYRVSLFDAKGKLLRSDDIEEASEGGSAGPTLPAVIADDPQAAAFLLYAQLLERNQRETVLVAFEKLVDVVDRLATQLDVERVRRVEAEDDLFNAEADRLEAERERIEQEKESGDAKEQILTAIVSGANASKAKGKPNGAVS